tara:strand:- start:498 stop:701 length:204 start_codon:yes stop_codon:yes gene_type:complete
MHKEKIVTILLFLHLLVSLLVVLGTNYMTPNLVSKNANMLWFVSLLVIATIILLKYKNKDDENEGPI